MGVQQYTIKRYINASFIHSFIQGNAEVCRVCVMFDPPALEEDIELPVGLCIVEVEDTGYRLSCTGLESPPTEEVHHQIRVLVQYVFDLVKCPMLGPNADVIGID